MFKKVVFKNGLRLVLSPLQETKSVTLLVIFGVGSRYEKKDINGISHLIEHMMFKGTAKRPNSLALSKELDGVGAEYNAFTSKDVTGYYIKINQKHLELALDVLSDMLFNSKFDPEEVEREKMVVMEEINMYEDNPIMFVEELFEEIVFKDNSLGWIVSGSKKSVKNLDQKKMVDFKDGFYRPQNTVIGLAGNLDSDARELVEKYFVKHTNEARIKTNNTRIKFALFKSKQTKPQVNLKFKETEQTLVALGFPSYKHQDPRLYVLILLGIILGGNMSSRLFIRIRERLGLAYSIRSSVNTYQDIGNFVVQAGLDIKRIDEAIKAILGELKKIKDEGVTEEELKRARDFIDGKITIDLEDSSSIADWYAKQELLTGEMLTPEEKLKKIFAVTAKEIQAVAKDIIRESKLNLTVIGPFKDKNRFLKLLKI
jgi:predicted Zn-dependent peptidase